jgi:hypothetical protein
MADEPSSQRGLYQFMRANRTALDVRVADMIVGCLQSMTLARGAEMKLDLDKTGYAKFAASKNDQHFSAEIPEQFGITVPVFEGIELQGQRVQYEIEVFLSIELTQDGPTFTLEAPALDQTMRKARRDAAAFLTSLLDQGLLVGLGRYLIAEVPSFSGDQAYGE